MKQPKKRCYLFDRVSSTLGASAENVFRGVVRVFVVREMRKLKSFRIAFAFSVLLALNAFIKPSLFRALVQEVTILIQKELFDSYLLLHWLSSQVYH